MFDSCPMPLYLMQPLWPLLTVNRYLHPPCVEHNFFNDAKKVLAGNPRRDMIYPAVMCANTKLYVATELCCEPETIGFGYINCTYVNEKVRYTTMESRCAANGLEPCHPMDVAHATPRRSKE